MMESQFLPEREANTPGNNEAGFTLTELLVSLMLLSLLMTLIWTAYSFNLRVFANQREQTSLEFQNSIVRGFMTDHLARARPFVDQANQRSGQIRFEGRRDQIRFVSALNPRWGGFPQEMVLSVTSQNALVLGICENISPISPWCDAPDETVLLGNIDALQFSYFDMARQTWRDSWVRETRLPDLIRIRIESETERETEFVVTPRIDVDTTCYFNPVTRSCRGRR